MLSKLFATLERENEQYFVNASCNKSPFLAVVHWLLIVICYIQVFPQLPERKVDRSGNYILPYFSYFKFVIVTDKSGSACNSIF